LFGDVCGWQQFGVFGTKGIISFLGMQK